MWFICMGINSLVNVRSELMAAAFDKCPVFKWVRCDCMIDYTWKQQLAFLSRALNSPIEKHSNDEAFCNRHCSQPSLTLMFYRKRTKAKSYELPKTFAAQKVPAFAPPFHFKQLHHIRLDRKEAKSISFFSPYFLSLFFLKLTGELVFVFKGGGHLFCKQTNKDT